MSNNFQHGQRYVTFLNGSSFVEKVIIVVNQNKLVCPYCGKSDFEILDGCDNVLEPSWTIYRCIACKEYFWCDFLDDTQQIRVVYWPKPDQVEILW